MQDEKDKISVLEVKSSNGKHNLKIKGYNLEKSDITGVCIVLHGMGECKDIYTELAEYLAKNNYGVIIYDNLGHGDTVNVEDERGFFANEDGYTFLYKDLAHIVDEAKKFNVPVFIFGHSMGSLIVRKYISMLKNKEINGAILCGTIGQQWAIDGAIQFANYMIEKKGPRYRSRKLYDLLNMVSKITLDDIHYKLEWSTRDKEYVKKALKDNRMNFIFTASGFKDLFTLVKLTGEKENIEKIPKELPILMISGSDDVLGEYGEGVKRLEEAYLKAGIKDVSLKIYEKARHNLIQEINRNEVFNDIYNWIEAVRFAEE